MKTMWEAVVVELLRADGPLTTTELARRMNVDSETLAGLLYRKTRQKALTRKAGHGPRGGYGYSLPWSRTGVTAYDHLLEDA